ncbi:MAG: PEP-CTERM-box response regulator transcription factor [Nitrospirota bacterium]
MTKPRLLVVDDEEAIRNQMRWALADEYDVLLAEDRSSALEQMKQTRPDAVLLDLGLPPAPREATEGLQALAELLAADRQAKIIVITGNHDRANALRAVEQGAFDFFSKPADIPEVRVVLKRALRLAELERENDALRQRLGERGFEDIVGESTAMQKVFAVIRKVATTDASVLIVGESGTGKELVAQAIHRSGDRRDGSFVVINCGAIPETLLESELFGHEKGSFTHADARRKGKFEYADNGTLFLDEIGELPLSLQVKLLRFLQDHRIERVGGRELIPLNVRIIAATNRDLKRAAAEGRFRDDLYFRLGIVTITMPPLREREHDAMLLARTFLQRFAGQYHKEVRGFSADAAAAIRAGSWPGNVRELEHRVKRGVIMADGALLTAQDIEMDLPADASPTRSLRDVRDEAERRHVQIVLERCGGNVSRAASELAVSRPTLHELIKKYGLRKPPETDPE